LIVRTLSQATRRKELAMATITDRQVRLLWRLLDEEHDLTHAALESGMDRKTARR